MLTQTFHQFSLLPTELQQQIWDEAVRPRGSRGVQFFTTLRVWGDDEVPERFKNAVLSKTEGTNINVLAAPALEDNTSPVSWNVGNKSTYAIDGGLWTACKESREAMHRRYNPDKWARFRQQKRYEHKLHRGDWYFLYLRASQKAFPATFKAQTESETQYFTVLPHYDLIILRPWDWDYMPSLDRLMQQTPFTSPRFGYQGAAHIAIEFDPSWSADEVKLYRETPWHLRNDPSLDSRRCNCYDALAETIRPDFSRLGETRLWIVDYRLRRKIIGATQRVATRRASPFDDHDLVFEGEGCKYFPMPRNYNSDFCGYDIEETPSDNIFDFVWEIQRLACTIVVEDQDKPEESDSEIDEDDVNPKEIGILVCERD